MHDLHPDGTLLIRKSKTDQEGRGAFVALGKSTRALLKAYIDRAQIDGPHCPLFCPIRRGDNPQIGERLTTHGARVAIQKRAGEAGLDGVSGHSARIGMAQALAEHGASRCNKPGVGTAPICRRTTRASRVRGSPPSFGLSTKKPIDYHCKGERLFWTLPQQHFSEGGAMWYRLMLATLPVFFTMLSDAVASSHIGEYVAEGITLLILLLVALGIVFVYSILPMIFCWKIAKRKDTTPIIWLLLSLVFGWLALLVLVCLVYWDEHK